MRFWPKRKQSSKQNKSQLGFERLENREMLAVIPLVSGEATTFRDADGTTVKVKLLGPGQGTIELVGGVLDGAAIDSLTLTGTTGQSKLKITTRGGSVAGTTINELVINKALNELGALKYLKADKVTLADDGEFSADGDIGSLQLKSLGDNSTVDITGSVGDLKVKKLQSDANIEIAQTLSKFVADLLAAGSKVTAETIDTMKVKSNATNATIQAGAGGIQNFQANFLFNTNVISEGYIHSVVVNRDMLGSSVAGNMDAGSDGEFGTIDDFAIESTAEGHIGSVKVRGRMGSSSAHQSNVVANGAIGQVLVNGRDARKTELVGQIWSFAASSYILLDIEQAAAAATGYGDDEVWIAVYGQEIPTPTTNEVPPPGPTYFLDAGNTKLNRAGTRTVPIPKSTSGIYISPDTPDMAILPSSTIQEWGTNLNFPVPKPGNQYTGRIIISVGAPVQAQIASSNWTVAAPTGASMTDPSTGTFYDFVEFTVTNNNGVANLDMDTSQVDSFGMPMQLQFFKDAANTPFDNSFTANIDPNNLSKLTNVTNINLLGQHQPISTASNPRVQAGTTIDRIDTKNNAVYLTKPLSSYSSAQQQFTAEAAGPVGVNQTRDVIMHGDTPLAMLQFITNQIAAGNSRALPFLQAAAPYATLAPVPIVGTSTDSVTGDIVINTYQIDPNRLKVNDVVSISGVSGNTNANGVHTVSAVDISTNSFTLSGVTPNGVFQGGGTWSLAITNAITSDAMITADTTGLSNGDVVTIANVGGNTAVNGQFFAANVTASTFTLSGPVANAPYTTGGSWYVPGIGYGSVTGATNPTNSQIQITTSAPHGLTSGAVVTITGVGGNTAANGTYVIQVDSSTTFLLGSPAGSGAYTIGGTWATTGGTTPITGATNGGEVVLATSDTSLLADGDLVQIAGVLGNTGANGFFSIDVGPSNTFTLVGSSGTGTFAASPGTWSVYNSFGRLISPSDLTGNILSSQNPNALNNYFNEMIDAFFLNYYAGTGGNSQTFSVPSAASGKVYNYSGTVVPNESGAYVLRLSSSNPMDKAKYDIYYPFFTSNPPATYTPKLTPKAAPSWIVDPGESASQMLFGQNGVWADSASRKDFTGNQAVLGDLENVISTAFNRGIALNTPSTWSDFTTWYQQNEAQAAEHHVQPGTYNYWGEFWHQQDLMLDELAYAFPYDDKFGASTDLNQNNVYKAKLTLGAWSAARTSSTTSITAVTSSLPTPEQGGPATIVATVAGTGTLGGTVSFFINGIAINPNDASSAPAQYPVELVHDNVHNTYTATIDATLPALSTGAVTHTYTITAVYSGDANNLPSIDYNNSFQLTGAQGDFLMNFSSGSYAVGGSPSVYIPRLPGDNFGGTIDFLISPGNGNPSLPMGTNTDPNMMNPTTTLAIPQHLLQFTGDLDGTATIKNIANTANLKATQVITGPNIPANTTILSVGTNEVTLSNTINHTATGLTFTSNGAGATFTVTGVFTNGASTPVVYTATAPIQISA